MNRLSSAQEETAEQRSGAALVTGATDARDVVRKLGSNKKEEREAAEQAISKMGPAAVEALVEVVKQESEGYRKKQRCYRYGMVAFAAAVLLPIVFIVGRGLLTGVWKGFGDYFTFLPSMVGALGAVAAVTQLHKNAATALASVADMRAIGALIDVLEMDDKKVKEAATHALTRLLPQLSEADAGLLTVEHRRILNRAVVKSWDKDFVLAVLDSYKHIGTGGEVEAVAVLAESKSRATGMESVRVAAKECLPVLEERAAREKEASTLVRAAANPAEPSDSLLRVAGNSIQPEEQLLRPAGTTPSE